MIQLNPESHFHNDLGLDSLDAVEVVMAIEEVCYNCRTYDTRVLTVCRSLASKFLTRRQMQFTAVCRIECPL